MPSPSMHKRPTAGLGGDKHRDVRASLFFARPQAPMANARTPTSQQGVSSGTEKTCWNETL